MEALAKKFVVNGCHSFSKSIHFNIAWTTCACGNYVVLLLKLDSLISPDIFVEIRTLVLKH